MKPMTSRWQFVRSETIELLQSLSDEQLLFKPEGDRWQPLYYQFGCMARTQLIYARAAEAGRMDFSLFRSSEFAAKDSCQTLAALATFLGDANDAWLQAIALVDEISWSDGVKPVAEHIMALAEHERLHHGQLISYFTMAGYDLPSGFRRNWAL